ncbi:MAG: hypothetical protein AAB424_02630 [Patescibacteria group bacterium]
MKRFFTVFSNFMDRLKENEHAMKCMWIYMCVAINAALGALMGKVIGELLKAIPITSSPTVVQTCALYGMVGIGGIVLLGMLANYRKLWERCGF